MVIDNFNNCRFFCVCLFCSKRCFGYVEIKAQQNKFLDKAYESSFGLNVTETDFRQYDSALGRFYSIDALAERSFDVTPYHYGLNNPVYWADPTGLISDPFWNSIWSFSPSGVTNWQNVGGSFLSDRVNPNGTVWEVFYDGSVTETLSMMYMEAKAGAGGGVDYSSLGSFNIGKRVQDHVYRNSSLYQYHRDQMRERQMDEFQSGLEVIGTADPTFLVDGINSVIYLIRGQYGNAAIAGIAMVPYLGDLGKGGKYLNKILKYEKLSDGYGTRAYIKNINNTTPINTEILFNDITQGSSKKLIQTPKGNIINATMSDGSIIQLRNFSTKSGDLNHSTIQFIGTQNKWKFNY